MDFFRFSSVNSYKRRGCTVQDGKLINCLFCDIIAKKEPATIVTENDEFVVFRTIAPYVENHLLTVPRKHIRSANELKTEDDAEMLERMITLSEQVATNIDNVSKPRLCFHIPPFNSIDHIHLHVLCSPETLTIFGKVKYAISTWYCQSVEQVLSRIRSDLKFMNDGDGCVNTEIETEEDSRIPSQSKL
jgi:diadenosine tetraphosphate (Ap4A) HIT family hydrolase